ncbi:MAG TPA: YfiR family protein, partial [Candidatus Deferrimicrobium sp.]|nr:YfiR family protein [Candidatus Deferrimicrobium sp.]
DIPGCHILFVSRSMKNMLPQIVAVARQNPILTVADTEGFAKKGIYINIYIERQSPKYEINETALKLSNLKVRYQLFEWGKRINPLN